jgi:hypothetical protein
VATTADGVPHRAENHEYEADDEHDDADRPNDWNSGYEANNEKDYAEDDHGEVGTSETRSRRERADWDEPTLSKV